MKLSRLIAGALFSIALAQAAVITTNLPSDTSAGSYYIDSTQPRIAVTFTPSFNLMFDSATALVGVVGDGAVFDVCVADDATGVPGTCLQTLENQTFPADVPGAATTFDFGGFTMLNAGTPYWLVLSWDASNPDSSGPGFWYINSGNIDSGWVFFQDQWYDGEGVETPAFEINGTAVTAPEPGSLGLAAFGALALAGVRRFRRRRLA